MGDTHFLGSFHTAAFLIPFKNWQKCLPTVFTVIGHYHGQDVTSPPIRFVGLSFCLKLAPPRLQKNVNSSLHFLTLAHGRKVCPPTLWLFFTKKGSLNHNQESVSWASFSVGRKRDPNNWLLVTTPMFGPHPFLAETMPNKKLLIEWNFDVLSFIFNHKIHGQSYFYASFNPFKSTGFALKYTCKCTQNTYTMYSINMKINTRCRQVFTKYVEINY